jgi:hypothetical protein
MPAAGGEKIAGMALPYASGLLAPEEKSKSIS